MYAKKGHKCSDIRRTLVVSPLGHVPGNIHGFIIDEKSYRQGLATAKTTSESANLLLLTGGHSPNTIGRFLGNEKEKIPTINCGDVVYKISCECGI